jgi:hypothetical protein
MRRNPFLPVILVSALLTAVACGDDDNDNPAPPDVSTGGSNPNAGSGNKAGNGGKGNAGGADTGNDGGGPDTTDGGEPTTIVGGQGGGGNEPEPEPECNLPELGKDGCFNCPKNGVVEQFLNRCTEGDIVEFDNADRLPLLEADGSLPDLPN